MKYLLILFVSVFGVLTATAQNNNPNAPVMKFVEETHDFGNLPEGPVATYDFWFTNTGKESLIIRKCSASCGCTTPDWTKTPIQAGQRGKITVKYTTEGHPGNFNKTVYISSNAQSDKEMIEIHIKGFVQAKEKPVETKTGTAIPVKN